MTVAGSLLHFFGTTPPEEGGRLWIGSMNFDHVELLRRREFPDLPEFVIGRAKRAPDGTLWVVGQSKKRLTVAAFDEKTFAIQGRFSLPEDSWGQDIDFDQAGNAWVVGEEAGRLWLGKISSTGQLLESVKLIDWSYSAAAILRDKRGNIWVASGQYVRDRVDYGVWLARLLESPNTSTRNAASLSFDYKDPARAPELVEAADSEIKRLLKAASESSSSQKLILYSQAWSEAERVNDSHALAEIDYKTALVRIERAEFKEALASLERAAIKMNGVPDLNLWISIVKSMVLCANALDDKPKILETTQRLENFYKRAKDKANEELTRVDVIIWRLKLWDKTWKEQSIRDAIELDGEFARRGEFARPDFYLEVGGRAFDLHQMRVAAHFLKRGYASAAKAKDARALGLCAAALSKVNTGLGNFAAAMQYANEASKAVNAGGADVKRASLEALGYVHQQLGFDATSTAYLRDSIEIAQSLKEETAFAHMKLGAALMNQGAVGAAYEEAFKARALGTSGAQGSFEAERLTSKTAGDRSIGLILTPADKLTVGISHLECWWTAKPEPLSCGGNTNYPESIRNFDAAVKDGEGIGDDEVALGGMIGRGLAYEGLEQWPKAVARFTEAVDRIEMTRWRSPAGQKINIFGARLYPGFRRLEPYDGLVRTHRRIVGGAPLSFYFAEATKARTFAEELVAPLTVSRAPRMKLELIRRIETDLRKSLDRLDLTVAGTDQERATIAEEIRTLWNSRKAAIAGFRQKDPIRAARLFPEPLPVENVRLKPGELLIEYAVTDSVTVVFAVRDGTILVAKEFKIRRQKLRGLVREYLLSFQQVRSSDDLARFDPKPGRQLYETIFKPLLDERDYLGRPIIAKNDKLIIVPDDALRLLPFEALPMNSTSRQEMPSSNHGPVPLRISYLADEFDIAYQYSATALMLQRTMNRPNSLSGLLILADPIFSPADSRSRETTAAEPGKALGSAMRTMGAAGKRRGTENKIRGDDTISLPRLDKTGIMARQLMAGVFPGGGVDLLEGARATKMELLNSELESMRYLIFATHGVVAGDIPGVDEPALLLTQDPKLSRVETILTRSDVMKMRLNADVVALTACKTGLGDQVMGEGVLSLGRAFQIAGAHAVLLTMWEVAEDSTNELVKSFFTHLKGGKSKRDALRLARQEIRRAGYAHPFYWAPFVLVTD